MDVAYFFELETSLHKGDIRDSVEVTSALLADTFVEFGSSGRVWSKSSIVESLATSKVQISAYNEP